MDRREYSNVGSLSLAVFSSEELPETCLLPGGSYCGSHTRTQGDPRRPRVRSLLALLGIMYVPAVRISIERG